MRSAFTVVELMVCTVIVGVIGTAIFLSMIQGSRNVLRGSFNAMAANQAAWITTHLRRDLARIVPNGLQFEPDDGTLWKGTGNFSILTSLGPVEYRVESQGDQNVFLRKELDDDGRVVRRQTYGADMLSEISIERDDNAFSVSIRMEEPNQRASPLHWQSTVFIPSVNPRDLLWKPLSSM